MVMAMGDEAVDIDDGITSDVILVLSCHMALNPGKGDSIKGARRLPK